MKRQSPLYSEGSLQSGPAAPDLTPEARRHQAARFIEDHAEEDLQKAGFGPRAIEILRRVVTGAWHDGFVHAGNMAYMAMLAIFPFFILGAAAFSLIGEESERAAAINAVVYALPPVVSKVIAPVARNVIEMRTGWLLWAGGLAGLWTVSSLVETIRDLLRRAYGTTATLSFWRYRLISSGIIIAAVILLMVSLIAQVLIGMAQEMIAVWLPQFQDFTIGLSLSRVVPALGLFGSIYLLFLTLTPARYRSRRYPKWPGALLVTVWWLAVAGFLPPLMRGVFAYNLTYGSLAGMMIALFFFWLVGLGMVFGAELNAALAETPEESALRNNTETLGAETAGAPAPDLKQGDIS